MDIDERHENHSIGFRVKILVPWWYALLASECLPNHEATNHYFKFFTSGALGFRCQALVVLAKRHASKICAATSALTVLSCGEHTGYLKSEHPSRSRGVSVQPTVVKWIVNHGISWVPHPEAARLRLVHSEYSLLRYSCQLLTLRAWGQWGTKLGNGHGWAMIKNHIMITKKSGLLISSDRQSCSQFWP